MHLLHSDKKLPLFLITVDDRLRVRKNEPRDTITEYTHLYSREIDLGNLEVVWDGKIYWLISGFLRIKAAQNAGLQELNFNIYSGTFDEAKINVLNTQNITNPVRLSKKDRLHKVEIALSDPVLSTLNERELSSILNVPIKEIKQVQERTKEEDEEDSYITLSPLELPASPKEFEAYYQLTSNCAIAKEKPTDYKPDLVINFAYCIDDCFSLKKDYPTVDLIFQSESIYSFIKNRANETSQTRIFWLGYGITALINCPYMEEEIEDTKVKTLEDITTILISKLTNWRDKILLYNPEHSILSLPTNRYYLSVTHNAQYFEMELQNLKNKEKILT